MFAKVKGWEDHQHYKDRTPPCVVYVNWAEYQGRRVSKVGFSNNPDKRLKEFNNGLRHLLRKGYLGQPVAFARFFSAPLAGASSARAVERAFFEASGLPIISEMGREVVDCEPGVVSEILCRAVGWGERDDD